MENTLHSVFQRYCQFALLWWTKSVDRSILLTARSIGTDLDTLVQILPSGSLRTWIQQPPHLNNCCAVPELMVQMGRQCCNELESCSDGKNWQSTLKLSYIRDWRGNAFRGDILWHEVWFVLTSMLEGIILPSNMAAKTTFCLCLVKRLIVTLRCAVNVTASSLNHFSWNLGANFVFRTR